MSLYDDILASESAAAASQSTGPAQDPRFKASLFLAAEVSPDQVAGQRRIARTLGVPAAAVEATPQESQTAARVQEVDTNTRNAPVARQRYSDADFAKLAHDDSSNLSAVETAVRGLGAAAVSTAKYVTGYGSGGLVRDMGAGVLDLATGAAGMGRAAAEVAAPLLDPLESITSIGGNPLRRLAEGFDMAARTDKSNADSLSPPTSSLVGGGVSSGVRSFTGNALTLPLALLNPAMALGVMAGGSGGQAYQQAREQGMGVLGALPFATSQAAIEYATEKLPLKFLLKDLGAGAGLGKTLLRNMGGEQIGEQIATALQDLNEWAVLPENASKPFSAYLADRPSAFAQTAIATAIGVGGQVTLMKGIQGAVDRAAGVERQAAAVEQDTGALQQLMELAKTSKLRERDPSTFGAVVQEMAEKSDGGAPTHVFIDAAVLADTLKQSGIDEAQLVQLMPTVPAQMREALASGGVIEIPIGDVAANIAGTDLEGVLMQNVRTSPEALSPAEAKDATSTMQETVEADVARVSQQAEQEAVAQTSAEAVKANLLGQLNTAGRFTPDVNDAYATLVRDFYSSTAARLGVTPEEAYQQYPLTVGAVAPRGVGGFDQSVQDTAPFAARVAEAETRLAERQAKYPGGHPLVTVGEKTLAKARADLAEAQTQRAGFDAWFGDSKAVTPDGKPRVLYHGTGGDITEFRRKEGGRAIWAASAETANTYAGETPGSNVLPIYLKMGNPLELNAQGATWQDLEFEGERVSTDDLARIAEERGHDGLIIRDLLDQNEDDGGTDQTDHYAVFKPTQIKSAIGNNGEFNPNDPNILRQSTRGTFNPATLNIALLQNADLSTFLHETGHFFLEVLSDLASHPNAPADVQQDMGKLLEWFGVAESAPLTQTKITDSDGNPLTVYHGTTTDFDSFSDGMFTSNRGRAENYAMGSKGRVLEAQIDMRNPMPWAEAFGKSPEEIKAAGYDGTVQWGTQGEAMRVVVVDPGQVHPVGRTALETWRGMTLDQQRPYHEKFAESFEQYLFEGKAPSRGLQPLFNRFRSWMTAVYRSLSEFMTGRNLQLSDDVRGVFDRLLATADQIAETEAAAAYRPVFESLGDSGMTIEQWETYQATNAEATADAQTALQARSLRDMQWTINARGRALRKLQTEAKEKRDAVEAEVTAEVDDAPEMRAAAALRELTAASPEQKDMDKDWRDRREAAVERSAAEAKAALLATPEAQALKGIKKGQFLAKNRKALANDAERRVIKWEQANPKPVRALPAFDADVVGEQFGFSSGDEMLKAIDAYGPRGAAIEGLTDQRMLERYGDLATPEALARAANDAVHNEARGRFIATEAKALADAMAQRRDTGRTDRKGRPITVNSLTEAARLFADRLVTGRKIRDIRPAEHSAAETRAAKRAEQAHRKNDLVGTLTAKRDQLLQHFATRYSTDALAEVTRGVNYLNRVADSTTLPADYKDQIDALLDRYDLRRSTSNRQADRRKSLLQWVDSLPEGVTPNVPEELLNEARRVPYRETTLEEFRGLLDTVKQIEHLGRLKDKLLTAKEEREFAAVVDAMVAGIIEHGKGRDKRLANRTSNTLGGAALEKVKKFWAAHIKSATWARIMDGGQDGGPIWENLIRGANDAGNNEVVMREQATKALTDLVLPVLKRGKMGGKGTFFPGVNRSFNREAILSMALNTGNDSNLQRLLGGEGWTAEQLQPMLDTLSAEDWQFVQAVWDYFESYRPQIAAKERRVFGVEPEWIPAAGRVVRAQVDGAAPGQTAAVTLRGGYYPVKYDPRASNRAGQHADAEQARLDMKAAYTSATTRRSFTKARVDEVNGRPLLYALDGIYNGVQEVIHDLAWHEFLIDANRLVGNDAVASAMSDTYGVDAHAQFKSWLKDTATGDTGAQSSGEAALGWIRQGVSIGGLGFNIMSAVIQPLGLTQSVSRIGGRYVAKGVAKYIAEPIKTVDEINAKSDFMRTRGMTRLRELAEVRTRVKGQTTARRAVDSGAYFMMLRAQQMVDVPTWWGGYEKAVAEGNDEDRAVALADQAVIDSQGGGSTKDQAAIERGGAALKLFTTFYSFFNVTLNNTVAQTMTAESKAKLAADYVLLLIAPVIMGELLRSALTPGDDGEDEETMLKHLLGAQISFIFGLMFGVREFAGAVQTATGTAKYPTDYAGPGGVRFITDVGKLAKQVDQGEADVGLRKAIVNVVGQGLRLPAAQINRSITGAEALAEGKTENPLVLILGFEEPK